MLPRSKYLKSQSRKLRSIPDWLWLVLISGFLRLVNLGAESLWFDEAFTATVANPRTDFWRAVIGDNHPPLWSIIEALVYRTLGQSEFAIRLPSALFSISSVLLIWRIALVLKFEKRTAFIAGLLAAFMPAGIYFAQDGRMYSMLTFFVLLALYGALKEKWFLLFAGGLGAAYTQNAGVVYILALGLAILIMRSRTWKKAIRPALALGGAALAWSPWSVIAMQQASALKDSFWTPPMTPTAALIPLPITIFGWRLLDPFIVPIFGAAVGMSMIALINSRRWVLSRRGMLVLAVVFGGPILLAIISFYWRNIYIYRILMPSATAMMLLWAYPLAHLARPNRRVAQAIMIPCFAIGVICHYLPVHARDSMPAYTDIIRANWRPGDVVYHTSTTTLLTIGFYSQDLPHVARPAPGDYVTVTDACIAAFHLSEMDIDVLYQHGYKRAWVILVETPLNRVDEVQAINRILSTKPTLIRTSEENGFERTYLYLVDLKLWQYF